MASDMTNWMNRLATFEKYKGRLDFPSRLASDGFYYNDNEKKIHCASCSFSTDLISDVSYQNIIQAHQKQSFECKTSRRSNEGCAVNDITTEQRNGRGSSEQTTNCLELHETNEPEYQENHLHVRLKPPSSDRANPDYNRLLDESTRLDTFYDWPRTAKAAAQELSRAGFFYTGEDDIVQCVSCRGKLRKWESWDIPMQEHRKHFSHCSFVKSQLITASHLNGHTNQPRNTQSATGLYNIDPREVKARLDLPQVRYLQSKGFTRDVIRAAIEHRLMTTGDDFPSTEELLLCLEDLQGCATSSLNAAATSQPESKQAKEKSNKLNVKTTTTHTGVNGATQLTTNSKHEAMLNGLVTKKEARGLGDLQERATCKICMDAACDVLFLPCRHLVTCSGCAVRLTSCPICRLPIEEALTVYH